MKLGARNVGCALALLIAACNSASDEADPTVKAENAPATAPAVAEVPAAFVGTWTSDGCNEPSVRIGVRDIRHFYAEVAAPLTAVTVSDDGRLVVTFSDEGATVTDTFQLTNGQLDQISSVSADSNDQFETEPMTKCSGPSPLD
ncbi:hypothetical protein [Brevundimonas bacteroides]|uniref:hypothetical protein n=1 Tax=Brevundimonas bacteroides TaxID=74311 RepID=UPI0005506B0A|nr:hypothetical protein [Brevundimonas bacteroides]